MEHVKNHFEVIATTDKYDIIMENNNYGKNPENINDMLTYKG